MKKLMILGALLLAMLLLASCDLIRPRPQPRPMPVGGLPAGDPAVSLPADDAPQGVWNNVLEFEVMEMETLPENVRAWAQEASQTTEKAAERMDDGEYTYILAGLGEKPSAGYAVETLSIEDVEAGKYTVTVKTTEPEEGSMNAAVMTHPAVVVRVIKTDLELVFVNEDGTGFLES